MLVRAAGSRTTVPFNEALERALTMAGKSARAGWVREGDLLQPSPRRLL